MPVEPVVPPRSGIVAALGVLRLPNFRRYVTAQLASSGGMWNQRVAELWLLLELTGDGLSLGVGTALRTAPAIFLASPAGWLADRYDRRFLLTATQAARGVIAGALAAMVFTGRTSLGLVYGLILMLGIVSALDGPMRRSFVRDVVDDEHLRSAAGLHTATISVGRIIGPFAAGFAIALGGVGWAFLLSVVSAVLAVASVRAIVPITRSRPIGPSSDGAAASSEPAARPSATTAASTLDDRPVSATDGGAGPSPALTLAPRELHLRDVLWLLGAFSTLGWNVDVVLPLFADGVLGQGPLAFSGLVICLSVGTLVGSVVAAGQPGSGHSFRSLTVPLFGFCLTLPLVAVSPRLVPVASALVIVGFCGGLFLAASNASLQLVADREPERQGRSVAAYTIVFTGSRAVGAPVLGFLVDQVGPRAAIVGVAFATFVAATMVTLVLWWPRRAGATPQTHTVG